MNKLFLTLASVLLLAACQKSDEAAYTPTETAEQNVPCILDSLGGHVIAFYPFSGGSVNDFSGNGRHLSINGGATSVSDRSGNPNCAYEFHDDPSSGAPTSEYLLLPQPTFLDSMDQFSISLWYEPLDSTILGGRIEPLLSRGSSPVTCPDRVGQWSLSLYDCRRLVAARTNSTWEQSKDCQEGFRNRVNHWHHAVAVFRKKASRIELYKDGQFQSIAVGDANCGSGPVRSIDFGDLFLGNKYRGRLDDVILFDKALTSTEVNRLYHTATCCP